MAIPEWADPGRVAKWERGDGADVGCPCCGSDVYGEAEVGPIEFQPGGYAARRVDWRCPACGRSWSDVERYDYTCSVISFT